MLTKNERSEIDFKWTTKSISALLFLLVVRSYLCVCVSEVVRDSDLSSDGRTVTLNAV